MKKSLFLLLILAGPLVGTAQYTISNFWGPYAPEMWDISEFVVVNQQQMTLTASFEGIYGEGGGGCEDILDCEEHILAEASIVLEHGGTLNLDYWWPILPVPAPDCLDRKMFKNGQEVSLNSVNNNGLAVISGDQITFQVVWYPWEMDCGAEEWDLIITNFSIEFSEFTPEPCPPPTPDLNGDGVVNAMDLLLLLAQFGQEV